jgi:hypothetical protein
VEASDYQTDGGEPETSVSVRQLRLASIILMITILSLSGNPYLGHLFPSAPQAHAASPAKIAVDPPKQVLLGQVTGQVTFTVNVTDAPSINGFAAVLTYNILVLRAFLPPGGLDYGGNVLCPSGADSCKPTVVRDCADGHGPACGGEDQGGVVALGLVLLTSTTTPPTTGKLFSVTFDILGSGFSEIHFRSATLTTGLNQTELPSVTSDGYFTNIDCPSSSRIPCTPPVVDFTVSPTPADLAITGSLLIQGKILIFNASARSTNSGGSIRNYYWIWGNPDPSQQGSNATITHVYSIGKPYYVTVRADDSSGASASKTKRITVINNLIDLAVDSATVNQDSGVVPGTVITVNARVLNNGTTIENANFTISVEGRVIGNTTFLNMTAHSRQEFTAHWNTAGYRPRAYRINAFVDYVRNPKNASQIIEDSLSNNLLSVFVQLVTPLPAGLSLSLLPSVGISLLVLAGAGAAGSRFLRKRPVDTELP